jgi:hypothetical protein
VFVGGYMVPCHLRVSGKHFAPLLGKLHKIYVQSEMPFFFLSVYIPDPWAEWQLLS